MTGFIVSVFPFRNRVSPKEAFEGLELGEGKLSRPVLRGPGGRKAAWLLGSYPETGFGVIDGSCGATEDGRIIATAATVTPCGVSVRLFVPQGHQRIDAHGPTSRQVAGRERHERQQHRDTNHG